MTQSPRAFVASGSGLMLGPVLSAMRVRRGSADADVVRRGGMVFDGLGADGRIGITLVMLNGQIVLGDGQRSRAQSGRVLRSDPKRAG